MSDSQAVRVRPPDPANVELALQLFVTYQAALRAYFYKRVRCRAEAEELAQEVYLRILRVPDASAIRNPEAYLFTIAGNLVKEHGLREMRRGHAVAADDPAIEEQLAEKRCAAEELDRGRRLQHLALILQQLSPKCRAVVALHYWHGLSYEEVAARLGISAHMVKKYVCQALTHCRRRMSGLR
jgi:RNA polymerase sigma-70 factor (ECF subfamily)